MKLKKLLAGITTFAIAATAVMSPFCELGTLSTAVKAAGGDTYADNAGSTHYLAENTNVVIQYDETFAKIVKTVKDNLKQHNTSFTATATMSKLPDDLSVYADAAFLGAFEHTGVENEGDFLANNYKNFSCSCKKSGSSGNYTVTFEYKVEYFTTKAQEKELDEKITQILDYLDLDGKSDYEKIYLIYSYVCGSAEYDWSGADDTVHGKPGLWQTAYSVLCKGSGVCQGFSAAIYRLMLSAGIDCRVITGDNYGMAHAWNIVKLDGKYYTIDASSDAEATELRCFLKNEAELDGHVADDQFKTEEFTSRYPISEQSYEAADSVLATEDIDGFKYSLGLDSKKLISYKGDEKDVVVPAKVNGIPVKKVVRYAFHSLDGLNSITFSEGIEMIGNGAAALCPELTAISIPSTAALYSGGNGGMVTGTNAFVQDCGSVSTVTVAEGNPYLCMFDETLYNKEKTHLIYYPPANKKEKVVVNENTVSVGDDVFAGNKNIKEVVLPDTLTNIGYWMFNGCSSLEKINIPKKCKYIGQYSFNQCALKELVLPAEFEGDIVSPAFFGCPIEKITVEKGNKVYSSKNNALISDGAIILYAPGAKAEEYVIDESIKAIANGAFEGSKNLKKVTIKAKLDRIAYAAFENCENLESVILPDSVKTIENSAFSHCVSLKEITIPKSVTEIGTSAFCECKALKNLVIPDGVTTIGRGAFDICSSLETVTIGSELKTLGNTAFDGCRSLKSFDVSADNKYFYSLDGALFGKSGSKLIKYPSKKQETAYVVPAEVKSIEQGAFHACEALTSITVLEGVTSIGAEAFENCYNLAEVILPKGLKKIGQHAFAGCSLYLESITIPDGVTTIENEAFLGCSALKTVTFPASLTSIGEFAFWCGDNITDVYYTGSEAQWKNIAFTSGNDVLNNATIHFNCEPPHCHSYSTKKTVKAATCTANGTEQRTCSCGKAVTVTVRAAGHTVVTDKAVAATCTKAGKTAGSHCSKCNAVIKAQTTVKATGHKYTDKVVAPTTTAQGYTLHTCSKCGDSYKDNYKDKLSSTVAQVTGLKLKGRAADALRISWNKNANADGYIVEMYKGGKWTRVAKITKNTTTEWRQSGLAAGTAYKFRVRAYKMDGKTALYSSYVNISARTNPSNVTGLKVLGKAKDALRIGWTKNTSADGYIVEMYSGGKWVRVQKITKNTTVQYRKAGLKKGTTYKFRVKAYKMSGSTALYSGYTTVSATTNK